MITSKSARAADNVTPDFIRPAISIDGPALVRPPGTGNRPAGMYTSYPRKKPSAGTVLESKGVASTPTTVSGLPFNVSVAPIAPSSLLNVRSQKSCEMTTTVFALPGWLSASVNSRPRSGLRLRTSNSDPVMKLPSSRCGSLTPVRFTLWPRKTHNSSKVWFCARSASYSRYAMSERGLPGCLPQTTTRRSACAYGNGRRSTALTMLNIAVLAPTPSASVRRATRAKPGRRFQSRSAYLTSCINLSITVRPPEVRLKPDIS